MSYLHVLFFTMNPVSQHQNAKNLVQKSVQKIIGNAMTFAFQSANNVMESVWNTLPLSAMILVFHSTRPVTACAITNIIRSIVMENAFTPDMKKKRFSKVDAKVRYRVK
jgi:hypothetical protein